MNSKCVKCGGCGAPRYHESGVSCKKTQRARADNEHLHFTCDTCGYDWTTDTEDAEDSKREEAEREAQREAERQQEEKKRNRKKRKEPVFTLPVLRYDEVPAEHREDESRLPPDYFRNKCLAACRNLFKFGEYAHCGHSRQKGSNFCHVHNRNLISAGAVGWTTEQERLNKRLWAKA